MPDWTRVPLRLPVLLALFALMLAPAAMGETADPIGDLEVHIETPSANSVFDSSKRSVRIEGGASIFGGVSQLDLFLVLDTSRSLLETDPDNYRIEGAVGLVESLPDWSDIQVGVVTFSKDSELVSPLTSNRPAVVEALRSLRRHGSTDIAGGIRTALKGFEYGGRPGSSRVILIFTDGKSNAKKARLAMQDAKAQGVAIHSLLLGTDRWGRRILEEVSRTTGGSFLQVKDPETLPEAFLNLRTTGIDNVTITVNERPPMPANLAGGSFSAAIELDEGDNQIVATATSLDGRVQVDEVAVSVRNDGCGELQVQAMHDGKPAHSVSQRSVEIVVDASRSMWGQIDGVSKMEIAKETLDDALGWLPEDVMLSLRAYGHQHKSQTNNCTDTELLVPVGSRNRPRIRSAVSRLRPNGQTPIAYSLSQIRADFASVHGEKAVVLVTDGIESCGGNAAAQARALQKLGRIPVHVIGFGMANSEDEDLSSLRAIALASGGRFITASSAKELRKALTTTVGTSFRISRDGEPVAAGTLGANDVIPLTPGEYVVDLDSRPAKRIPVKIESEVRNSLIFRREKGSVSHSSWQDATEYFTCENQSIASGGAVPAAPARGASSPREAAKNEPKSRKVTSFDIPDGSVEVWQNLRVNRKAEWGVVVRHPSKKKGAAMVWQGDDRNTADEVSRGVRDTMRTVDAD